MHLLPYKKEASYIIFIPYLSISMIYPQELHTKHFRIEDVEVERGLYMDTEFSFWNWTLDEMRRTAEVVPNACTIHLAAEFQKWDKACKHIYKQCHTLDHYVKREATCSYKPHEV